MSREWLVETMKARSKYVVTYERDEDGYWFASVRDVQGCHTQGRTIEQARERIREAIQVWFDLPKPYTGELADDVQLPAHVQALLQKVRTAKAQADTANAALSESSRRAVRTLVEFGVSLRDAGELLGLSRQRAQQLSRKAG